ncbi:hypothetical protein Bca4012_035094 [Brassica carinata]
MEKRRGCGEAETEEGYALRFPETSRCKVPLQWSCQPEGWTLVGDCGETVHPSAGSKSSVLTGGTSSHLLKLMMLVQPRFVVVKTRLLQYGLVSVFLA